MITLGILLNGSIGDIFIYNYNILYYIKVILLLFSSFLLLEGFHEWELLMKENIIRKG